LDLPLDIGGVDRAADVLRCDKAQDRHLAGLGIDLDIAELGREARRHAAEAAAVIGPPVSAFFAANSLNDKRAKSPTLLLAGLAWLSSQMTPSTSTSPPWRGARRRPFAGLNDRHPGGESDARAAGYMSVADRGGVGDGQAT
jgi:hypothetical protein